MTTIAQDREVFANETATGLAAQVGVTAPPMTKTKGWTTHAVWFDEGDRLTGVVGPQEGRDTKFALAHGLKLAEGRPLQLVLPKEWAFPTLQRIPWLSAPVTIKTFGSDHTVTDAQPPSREETQRDAGGTEDTPELHLGPAGEKVRALLEWAALHPDLMDAHRRDVRSWTCRGQCVLRVTRSGDGTVDLRAGIDAKTEPAKHARVHDVLTSSELADWQRQVDAGIAHARAKTYGAFAEHHLQEILRRNPYALGLEPPVLREVPAWRPTRPDGKLGRGFIDLVGRDGLGDIVLVETKLAADDMLVLQGLDYWTWATGANKSWLVQRLHGDMKRSNLRLLYAVGARDGGRPELGPYARAQFGALSDAVDWQLAFITDWEVGRPTVEFLPPRSTS